MKSVKIDVELEIESADKMSGQTLFDRQRNGFAGNLLRGNAVPFCMYARNLNCPTGFPFLHTLVCALHPVNDSVGLIDYAVIPPDATMLNIHN